MNHVTLQQIDKDGKVIDTIDYSIIKIIKETPSKIIFIGTTGFLEMGLVVANKDYSSGNLKYIIGNKMLIPIPISNDITGDE